MSKEIVIKGENFYSKASRIAHVLNESQFEGIEAMLVNLGVVKEDDNSPKTCLFHLWLLAFEFSETIMGFSRERCVILTSNRKKKILEEMK